MSCQEEIEQFLFLDRTQPPRQLSAEEVEKFLDLCKKLNYMMVEAVVPINSPEKSVAELIRMVDTGEVAMGGDNVAGPYVMAQNSSSVYYPEGIMIYKRPAQEPIS